MNNHHILHTIIYFYHVRYWSIRDLVLAFGACDVIHALGFEVKEIPVEISLPVHTARWFRSMASVGRCVDSIRRAVDLAEGDVVTKDQALDLLHADDDLKELKRHFTLIHDQLRSKLNVEPLWDQNQDGSHN